MSNYENRSFINARMVILFILLPLFLGTALAAFIPVPKIGIIELKEPIDNATGNQVVRQIQYALNHPDIRAIVVLIDCPGGTINDTELVFLELNYLREKIPVVSMVEGLSASGAYYVSMATDYIYSNPSAMVGNVGVIGQLPPVPIVIEETYSTGPYKLWGTPRDTYVRQIDMMKRTFLEAVKLSRKDRLNITVERISRGEIYPASQALNFGLIDALGSQSEAIQKAAELAKIAHFHTVNLGQAVYDENSSAIGFFAVDENGNVTGIPKDSGLYYLYIPDFMGGNR
jgi:protease-4